MTKKLIILVDYRGQFWLKTTHKEANFDLPLLKEAFERLDYKVTIQQFSEIDFKNVSYKGYYIFYQSSEDPDLFYKSFIEDILLGLHLQGAFLIPSFEYFKAHHNKVFMEILRDIMGFDKMHTLKAWYFGAYEEFKNNPHLDAKKKYVFKLASGAQSKNVKLLNSRRKFYSIPRQMSRSFNFYYWMVDKIKPYWTQRYPVYVPKSHHRRKFILQEYLEGLSGDFKILVFPTKIFALSRKIKPGDFRASGSGRFEFIKDVPQYILDFANQVYKAFNVPYIGLDVADYKGSPQLIEFQFTHFGTYTAEKAPFNFTKGVNGKWIAHEAKIVLEEEIASAIDFYLRQSVDQIENVRLAHVKDNP